MRKQRAVSTVADVGLALVLVTAGIGVLVTFDGPPEKTDAPSTTDYTAETIASSTTAVRYDVRDAVAAARGINSSALFNETDYEASDLQRISHGPVAAHVAAIAVTNIGTGDSNASQVTAAVDYERVVDRRLQISLVGSNFDTAVDAQWLPFSNASLRGTTSLGQEPPPETAVSTAVLTVPSPIPSVRQKAIDAVDAEDEFGIVADIVARAIIDGYLPGRESQRALESGGVERDLVVYRYKRMAQLIDGASPDAEQLTSNLVAKQANTLKANGYLVEQLSKQLEEQLVLSFENAHAAARAVSTGEVTITVRTWST